MPCALTHNCLLAALGLGGREWLSPKCPGHPRTFSFPAFVLETLSLPTLCPVPLWGWIHEGGARGWGGVVGYPKRTKGKE